MLQYGEMLEMKKRTGLFIFVSAVLVLGASSLFDQVQAAEDVSAASSTVAETGAVDEALTAGADLFEPDTNSESESESNAVASESVEEGISDLEDSSIDPIAELSGSTNTGMPPAVDSSEAIAGFLRRHRAALPRRQIMPHNPVPQW